jgi:hypothetical protein
MRILHAKPGTDAYDEALRGKVMAERINYVIARSGSKRHDEYLELVSAQARGEPETDPNGEYRESPDRLHLVGNALREYRRRDGAKIKAGLIFVHDHYPIACAPHAVDSAAIIIQVHVRETLRTFERAVARGITSDLYRLSLAQMIVAQGRFALQINYFENPERGIRELVDHPVEFSRTRALDLMDSMITFARRSRQAEQRMAR